MFLTCLALFRTNFAVKLTYGNLQVLKCSRAAFEDSVMSEVFLP